MGRRRRECPALDRALQTDKPPELCELTSGISCWISGLLKRGHKSTDYRVALDKQEWDKLLEDLGLTLPGGQSSDEEDTAEVEEKAVEVSHITGSHSSSHSSSNINNSTQVTQECFHFNSSHFCRLPGHLSHRSPREEEPRSLTLSEDNYWDNIGTTTTTGAGTRRSKNLCAGITVGKLQLCRGVQSYTDFKMSPFRS